MIKFELNKPQKELYVKLFNKFLFAFKILKKKTKPSEPKQNKNKLHNDLVMSIMDTIPKEKRTFH